MAQTPQQPKKKRTRLQIMVGAAKKACANPTPTNLQRREDAIRRYKFDAMKKGKDPKDVARIVSEKTACPNKKR